MEKKLLTSEQKEELFQYWEQNPEERLSDIATMFSKKFGTPISTFQIYKIFLKKV